MSSQAIANKIIRDHNSNRTAALYNLAQVCAGLADNVRSTMSALYRLETAVINAGRHRIGLSTLRQQFEKSRRLIRAEWETDIRFLQSCLACTNEVIAFCQLSGTRNSQERTAFFKDICSLIQANYEEAQNLSKRHSQLMKGFSVTQKKLLLVFKKNSKIDQSSPFPGASPVTSNSEFVKEAYASLNPDGPASLSEAESALERLGQSLRDLESFWGQEVEHFRRLTHSKTPDNSTSSPTQTANLLIRTWVGHRPALQSAISSISASSDAVIVNAVGAPIPLWRNVLRMPKDVDNKGRWNLQKLLRQKSSTNPRKPKRKDGDQERGASVLDSLVDADVSAHGGEKLMPMKKVKDFIRFPNRNNSI